MFSQWFGNLLINFLSESKMIWSIPVYAEYATENRDQYYDLALLNQSFTKNIITYYILKDQFEGILVEIMLINFLTESKIRRSIGYHSANSQLQLV